MYRFNIFLCLPVATSWQLLANFLTSNLWLKLLKVKYFDILVLLVLFLYLKVGRFVVGRFCSLWVTKENTEASSQAVSLKCCLVSTQRPTLPQSLSNSEASRWGEVEAGMCGQKPDNNSKKFSKECFSTLLNLCPVEFTKICLGDKTDLVCFHLAVPSKLPAICAHIGHVIVPVCKYISQENAEVWKMCYITFWQLVSWVCNNCSGYVFSRYDICSIISCPTLLCPLKWISAEAPWKVFGSNNRTRWF